MVFRICMLKIKEDLSIKTGAHKTCLHSSVHTCEDSAAVKMKKKARSYFAYKLWSLWYVKLFMKN